jgi:hypothetical protein
MSDWKTIKTAPHDGTVILLRGGSTREGKSVNSLRPMTASWDGTDWSMEISDGVFSISYYDPTEWCEVPA